LGAGGSKLPLRAYQIQFCCFLLEFSKLFLAVLGADLCGLAGHLLWGAYLIHSLMFFDGIFLIVWQYSGSRSILAEGQSKPREPISVEVIFLLVITAVFKF
jgi:hypothetical protein